MNRPQAYDLLKEFHTPSHVVAHCEQVARVGDFLAQKLKANGILVDPDVVEVAGLIHDVVRVVDFKHLPGDLGSEEDRRIWRELRERFSGQHHADAAAQILRERDEEDLADVVARHKYSAIDGIEPPETWEAKLLYYADKRVAHTHLVSLRERLDEGRKRHYPDEPMAPEELQREKAVFALEREIFEHLSFGPEELAQLI